MTTISLFNNSRRHEEPESDNHTHSLSHTHTFKMLKIDILIIRLCHYLQLRIALSFFPFPFSSAQTDSHSWSLFYPSIWPSDLMFLGNTLTYAADHLRSKSHCQSKYLCFICNQEQEKKLFVWFAPTSPESSQINRNIKWSWAWKMSKKCNGVLAQMGKVQLRQEGIKGPCSYHPMFLPPAPSVTNKCHICKLYHHR